LLGELRGHSLTRPPKGFPGEHPAADLIKMKQWYWYVELEGALALTPRLLDEVRKRLRALTPVLDWMNRPMLERRKRDSRELL